MQWSNGMNEKDTVKMKTTLINMVAQLHPTIKKTDIEHVMDALDLLIKARVIMMLKEVHGT